MKPTKKDFQITQSDKNKFKVCIRKRFFIFTWWVELTELDGDKEVPLEYNNFDDAVHFINEICD